MNLPLPNRLSLSLTYLTLHHPPLIIAPHITTPHLSSPHLKVPHLSSPHLITLYSTYDLVTFIHPSISSHEYLTGNTSNHTSHIWYPYLNVHLLKPPSFIPSSPHSTSPHFIWHLIWPHFALPPLLTAFGWWRSNSMWVLDSAVLICQRDQWSINKTLLLEMTKYIIITDLPISKIKHVTKFWRLSDFYLCEQNTFFYIC